MVLFLTIIIRYFSSKSTICCDRANYLKNLSIDEFCQKAADLFGDINALHPFREGNGRTQREFFYHLAKNAKYKLDLNQLNKNEYMIASIESMLVNNNKIEKLIKSIIEPL
ncbi:Fic family protein [Megamonas funiformis]|uniref:Fic family protein n=1 Tax=Megamonas funiformis TaxID=437897 RepID=UPI003520EBDE